MPSLKVKLVDPTGTYTDWFQALSLTLNPAESFTAQTCDCTVAMKERHLTDGGPGNTAIPNSLMTIYWGSQIVFYGRLYGVERTTAGAAQSLRLTANSIFSDLMNARAGKDGQAQFSAATPTATQTEKTLRAGEEEGESDYPYYPDAASGCYLPIGAGARGETPNTTFHINTAHGSGEIICEATHNNMAPKGYAAIDGGTVIYYNGYQKNPDHDNLYTMYNVVWDVLGASGGADPVVAGTALHQFIPKQIAPDTTPKVEGLVEGGGSPDYWELLADGWYKVREHEGRIDFIGDPTAAPFSYLDVRMTYDTIEEDSVNRYLLADYVEDILTFVGTGGAALVAGDFDLTGVDPIPLPRVYHGSSITVMQAIQSAVTEMELDRYNSAESIAFYYDAPNAKFVLANLSQKETPDIVIAHAVQVVERLELAGLATEAIVEYQRVNPSLISPTRMWHPEVGRTFGTSQIAKLYWQLQDLDMAAGWQGDTTAGNNVRTQFLMDRNDASGIGIGCATGAGGPTWKYALYAWFRTVGGIVQTETVDRARVVLDLRRCIATDIEIELVGITSYTPGTPPSVSGIVKLSDYLHFKLGKDKGTRHGPVDRVAHGGQFGKGYQPSRRKWF